MRRTTEEKRVIVAIRIKHIEANKEVIS